MSTNSTAAVVVSPARARLSQGLSALALTLLLGLQPVTTDVYLPALPALTRALDASMGAAQLTMSALIMAFGIAQLFWGPVADRVGRRPVLISGLLLYTLASIGSAAAGSIDALVFWRVMQGASMAAAVVCARAMLRDLYEPHEGAKVMSLGLSGLGVIAITGPVIGGLAASAWGWRAALTVVAVVGALTLAFVVLRLPETLAQKDPNATRLRPLLRTWSRILHHRSFVAWTLLVSSTYGGLFTILAGSSFVYMDTLGLSAGSYGLVMAAGSSSYLVGTFACRRWIMRHGLAGAVQRGAAFSLAGGVSVVALAWGNVDQVWALLVPQCLFALGHGIHQPCGQAGAVGPFPRSAGAASAMAGFVLAATAFGVGLWLGRALDGSLMPYALTLGFWAAMTALVGWTLVPRALARAVP